MCGEHLHHLCDRSGPTASCLSIRFEAADPPNLTATIYWGPAVCQVDPLPSMVNVGFVATSLCPTFQAPSGAVYDVT
jgi:hypothetical protein